MKYRIGFLRSSLPISRLPKEILQKRNQASSGVLPAVGVVAAFPKLVGLPPMDVEHDTRGARDPDLLVRYLAVLLVVENDESA